MGSFVGAFFAEGTKATGQVVLTSGLCCVWDWCETDQREVLYDDDDDQQYHQQKR